MGGDYPRLNGISGSSIERRFWYFAEVVVAVNIITLILIGNQNRCTDPKRLRSGWMHSSFRQHGLIVTTRLKPHGDGYLIAIGNSADRHCIVLDTAGY